MSPVQPPTLFLSFSTLLSLLLPRLFLSSPSLPLLSLHTSHSSHLERAKREQDDIPDRKCFSPLTPSVLQLFSPTSRGIVITSLFLSFSITLPTQPTLHILHTVRTQPKVSRSLIPITYAGMSPIHSLPVELLARIFQIGVDEDPLPDRRPQTHPLSRSSSPTSAATGATSPSTPRPSGQSSTFAQSPTSSAPAHISHAAPATSSTSTSIPPPRMITSPGTPSSATSSTSSSSALSHTSVAGVPSTSKSATSSARAAHATSSLPAALRPPSRPSSSGTSKTGAPPSASTLPLARPPSSSSTRPSPPSVTYLSSASTSPGPAPPSSAPSSPSNWPSTPTKSASPSISGAPCSPAAPARASRPPLLRAPRQRTRRYRGVGRPPRRRYREHRRQPPAALAPVLLQALREIRLTDLDPPYLVALLRTGARWGIALRGGLWRGDKDAEGVRLEMEMEELTRVERELRAAEGDMWEPWREDEDGERLEWMSAEDEEDGDDEGALEGSYVEEEEEGGAEDAGAVDGEAGGQGAARRDARGRVRRKNGRAEQRRCLENVAFNLNFREFLLHTARLGRGPQHTHLSLSRFVTTPL
ncbi:hypothetical protein A0H81_11036 [Grifola frondosa]|uniref:Uncharacterized protein n=1 Tax=Grifola frondosa TaxID=5627 RepID=A0A1C7LVI7_GRIFR|nr:hypothetical protein A0H81_11036 [Grifola frondosa]